MKQEGGREGGREEGREKGREGGREGGRGGGVHGGCLQRADDFADGRIAAAGETEVAEGVTQEGVDAEADHHVVRPEVCHSQHRLPQRCRVALVEMLQKHYEGRTRRARTCRRRSRRAVAG